MQDPDCLLLLRPGEPASGPWLGRGAWGPGTGRPDPAARGAHSLGAHFPPPPLAPPPVLLGVCLQPVGPLCNRVSATLEAPALRSPGPRTKPAAQTLGLADFHTFPSVGGGQVRDGGCGSAPSPRKTAGAGAGGGVWKACLHHSPTAQPRAHSAKDERGEAGRKEPLPLPLTLSQCPQSATPRGTQSCCWRRIRAPGSGSARVGRTRGGPRGSSQPPGRP